MLRSGAEIDHIQQFSRHLIDRWRRLSVEPGFRGARQPSRRAEARSATGRGESLTFEFGDDRRAPPLPASERGRITNSCYSLQMRMKRADEAGRRGCACPLRLGRHLPRQRQIGILSEWHRAKSVELTSAISDLKPKPESGVVQSVSMMPELRTRSVQTLDTPLSTRGQSTAPGHEDRYFDGCETKLLYSAQTRRRIAARKAPKC